MLQALTILENWKLLLNSTRDTDKRSSLYLNSNSWILNLKANWLLKLNNNWRKWLLNTKLNSKEKFLSTLRKLTSIISLQVSRLKKISSLKCWILTILKSRNTLETDTVLTTTTRIPCLFLLFPAILNSSTLFLLYLKISLKSKRIF